MRKTLAVIFGVAVLIGAHLSIYERERLLADGRVVLLELAPVDPRSLMQGDYMALRFALANAAFSHADAATADGRLVLKVAANGVASFVRFHTGAPLAPDEIRMRYRIRAGVPRLATNAFFFQEGTGAHYAHARYGAFRVGADGEAILTALHDAHLRPIDARGAGNAG